MELLFERFLSEERGEWPDIDLDLPSGDQREKVIQYVFEKYGRHGAAMTAVVITYRTRMAVREMGKVLGLGDDATARLAALLSSVEHPGDRGQRATPRCARPASTPRRRGSPRCSSSCARVRGLPRHLGQHSGGIVIAAGRLDEVVPLEPARDGRTAASCSGTRTTAPTSASSRSTCSASACSRRSRTRSRWCACTRAATIDLAQLPPDDPATYAMIRRADTIGMFQIESRAQMATLPRMKPERFYDLVVEVAIIRPGPIAGKMVHPYLNRRAGREPVTYPAPVARADPRAHARRAAVPGAAAAHRDDRGRLHRRRGRGAAPRDGLQALGWSG